MDLFVVGEIVKTRGLRGCVKALSYLESETILQELHFLYLEDKSGSKLRYDINKIDYSGRFFFLEFKGVSDIDAAQKLLGSKLLLPRNLLEVLPDGEYYWQDIIGLNVYTTEGRHLGRITSIFPTGSNDVYVCLGQDGEVLIPAVGDVIEQIDLISRKITIKLLEGLLS